MRCLSCGRPAWPGARLAALLLLAAAAAAAAGSPAAALAHGTYGLRTFGRLNCGNHQGLWRWASLLLHLVVGRVRLSQNSGLSFVIMGHLPPLVDERLHARGTSLYKRSDEGHTDGVGVGVVMALRL